jgi:hypothetical protein
MEAEFPHNFERINSALPEESIMAAAMQENVDSSQDSTYDCSLFLSQGLDSSPSRTLKVKVYTMTHQEI